jgi:hypothetical protein
MGSASVTKAVVTVAADAARVHESEAIARRQAVKLLLVIIVKLPNVGIYPPPLAAANVAC